MNGTIRIDGVLAEQIDTLIRNFIQEKVFRGTVKVTNASRNMYEGGNKLARICYDVAYTGVLDILAGEDK